jgi:hypothetical protein
MAATREQIYVALFNLVTSAPTIASSFVTHGRLLRHHSQVGQVEMPALFLVQHPGEIHVRKGKGIPVIRTLECAFVMYFWTVSSSDSLPATICNNALDAIDAVLNPPEVLVTLGGLVEHVYTEGRVDVVEGLLQEVSIVTVPVRILIP